MQEGGSTQRGTLPKTTRRPGQVRGEFIGCQEAEIWLRWPYAARSHGRIHTTVRTYRVQYIPLAGCRTSGACAVLPHLCFRAVLTKSFSLTPTETLCQNLCGVLGRSSGIWIKHDNKHNKALRCQ